jgi:hypothetical protein
MAILLSRQINRSRTPAGISRVSRWSFLTQAVVDSICFAGVSSEAQTVRPLANQNYDQHATFAILAEGRTSLSLFAPAFLALILFVYEVVSPILTHVKIVLKPTYFSNSRY